MVLNCFSHTIYNHIPFGITDIYKLESIFKEGYVLSRQNLNNNRKNIGYNGMNYVSLCDLSKNHPYYSSYELFARKGLSLLFNKELDVIEPQFHEFCSRNKVEHLGNSKKRYTDLIDEVQVKDKVSLQHLIGLSISFSTFYQYNDEFYLKEYLKKIKEILENYHYQVPIINLDNGNEIKVK